MRFRLGQIKILGIFLIGITILYSCDKPDDYSKISKDYPYQGSLSLPVGKSELSMQFMGVNLDTSWLRFPDSILSKLPAIKLNDTIPFDITSLGQIEDIKELIFFIQLINDFPMQDTIKLLLADKNKNITQNITPQPISIDSATFSAQDSFPSKNPATKNVQPLIFNRDSLKNWTDAKYIIINATLKNDFTHKKLYKYFRYYYLHVDIAIQVDFDFNLKNLK